MVTGMVTGMAMVTAMVMVMVMAMVMVTVTTVEGTIQMKKKRKALDLSLIELRIESGTLGYRYRA